MIKKIPINVKYNLFYVTLFLVTFSFFRILFLIIYSYRLENYLLKDILLALAIGIRFDFSVIATLLCFFALLSTLNYFNKYKIFRFIWGYLPCVIYLWVIFHSVADLIYFENANKHIGYEGFVFLGRDLILLIESAIEENPVLIISVFLVSGIFFLFSGLIYFKFDDKLKYNFQKKIAYIQILIIIPIVVIFIRGGVQQNPLRVSNAIITNDNFINNIPLNPVFTTISDFKSPSIASVHKMDLLQASLIVRKEIDYPNASFISNRYPLLRVTNEINQSSPPNIVLVILENWTGKFIDEITDGKVDNKVVTPHFNQLLKKGLFFDRFYASGGRTTNGMMSILTGIPDKPGLTAVRTSQVLGNFSGLGRILKQVGYQSIFVTGGDLDFDNKKKLMPHWGFNESIGKEYFDKINKYPIGAWGYDDRDVLEVLHEKIENMKRPFLGVALTLTTHYPYRVPDKKFELFDSKTKDYEFLNVYHYADWALNEFIKKIEKSDYFENTIFLFVADHTHHRYLNYYEDRNIPFLIYAPNYVSTKIDHQIGSQLDIIPTILSLVGKKVYFSAMGRDLLSKKTNSAYFAYGDVFGWIEEDTISFQFTHSNNQLNYRIEAPYDKSKHCESNPVLCKMNLLKAKSFLNTSIDLMNKNLIFPPEDEIVK